MLTDVYEDGPPHPAIEEFVFSHNGMRWLLDLTLENRLEIVDLFRALPVAIEVETRRGLVGIVHAGVPRGMDWSEFTDLLQKGGLPKVVHHALWDRSRIDSGLATDVEGVGRVFVGHTIVPQAGRLGNVYYLDTGAYASNLFSDNPAHLTLADMTCSTQVFPELRHNHGFTDNAAAAASLADCGLQPAAEIPNPGQVRVIADAQPSEKPFSHYLMSRRPTR
jgi:serine/threonine protein phosphatase 1